MRGQVGWIAVAVACLLGAGCGRQAPPSSRTPAARLREVGLPLRFRPPADGILTDAQLDRYLRVRRAAKGRTDREAARAVGVDPDEFAWVRGRVIEAAVALDTRRVASAAEGTYARTIASLRESRRSARSPETIRAIDEQIAGLERERASLGRLPPLPPAVAANARRVAARRAEIDAS